MAPWARKAALFAVVLFAGAREASAEFTFRDTQVHARLGYFSASFSTDSATLDQSYSMVNALDLEYERFTSSDGSYLIRAILAYELSGTKQMRYESILVGRRFYLFSRGAALEGEEGGSRVIQTPKVRYFAGFDGGIALASIKQVSTVLEANATLLDLGANAGITYQMSRSYGIEFQVGMGLGVSFSAIPATATTVRATTGVAYFF